MGNTQQLVKKSQEGYDKVFPKTFLDAIKDRETGMSLTDILSGFNNYFLSYSGDKATTRLQVPSVLRKEGLWVTYVDDNRNVITEWYNNDSIDDKSWSDSSNWRIASNYLVGNISISDNGKWVINNTETEFNAIGETGITPLLRMGPNNKIQVSYNEGKLWEDISDYVVPKFRWVQGFDTTAGKIQISMDLGSTWTDLSNNITNNLRISKYIGPNESLPTSGIAEGTIYMKGPIYDENDTLNENPIYRMWVYAWKGNTLAWQDNGEFTSISAGVVQTITAGSTNTVPSTDAVYQALKDSSKGFVDDEPTTGSENLVKSGGVFEKISELATKDRYNLLSVNNIIIGNNNNNLIFVDFARKLQFYVSDELLSHNLIIGQFGYTENNGTFIYLYDTTDNKYLSKIVLSNSDIDNLTFCSAISVNKEYAVEGWFSTAKLKTGSNPDEKYGIFTNYNAVVATKTLSEYKLDVTLDKEIDRLDKEIDRLDKNIYAIGLTSSTDDDIVNDIVVYINSNNFNEERTYAISNINLTKGVIDIYERDLVNNIWLGFFKKLQFDNNVELYENLNDDVKYIVNVKQLKKLVNENKLTANDNLFCALIKPNGILTYLENKINEEKNRAVAKETELSNSIMTRTSVSSDKIDETNNLLDGVSWSNGKILTKENISLNESIYGDGQAYEGWYSCIIPVTFEKLKLYVFCYTSTVTVLPILFLDENRKVVSYILPQKGGINNIETNVPKNSKFIVIQAPDNIVANGYALSDWLLYKNTCITIKEKIEEMQNLNQYNLNILCVGDSLTEGDYGSEPSGTMNVQAENYPYYLNKYLGWNVENKGKCGYTTITWWRNIAQNIDYSLYDIMVVMLGTNGSVSDTLDTDVEPYDSFENYVESTCGCYCKIIEYALSINSNLCILIATPPYADANRRQGYYNNAQKANEPVKKIAKRYGLPCKDMFYEGGYNYLNTSVMQPIDGLHFGEIGYQRMAVTIGNFIKSHGTWGIIPSK